MKRSHDHTQLTRLAAISLVVVMCLSALPMLAPSASAAEPEHYDIVCIGDSITLGSRMPGDTYPEQLALITGSTVINAGVGSQTTAGMAARFSSDVLSHTPEIVVIEGGINDVSLNVPIATIKSNIVAMVTAATGESAMVILCTVTPSANFDAAQNAVLDELNAWIAAQASSTVAVADLYAALGSADHELLPKYDVGDGVHPNIRGNAAMTSTIIRAGQTIGLFQSVNVWSASEAGSASVDASWSLGTKPSAGQRVLFDVTAPFVCDWDLGLTSEYTVLLNHGAVTPTWTTVTDATMRLVANSPGASVTGDSVWGYKSIDIIKSATISGQGAKDRLISYETYIHPGATVTNAEKFYHNTKFSDSTFVNLGTINGPGTMHFSIKNNVLPEFGTITSPVNIGIAWDATSNLTMQLSQDLTFNKLSCTSAHTKYGLTIDMAGHSLIATSVKVNTRASIGNGTIYTPLWDSAAGGLLSDTNIVLADNGSAILAPGQSFSALQIASDDGRSASWNMTATGMVDPIVTGLKSGSYLWYLDGVEQGEVKADKDGTIALSYESTGLHSLEVKPTSMTIAMDGLAATIGIIVALAVLGGLFTMIGKAFGRLKF